MLFLVLALLVQQNVASKKYEEALDHFTKKNYLAAIAAARRAVEEDGQNPDYRHLYGLALAGAKQFTQAEENLKQAISLEPNRADFHHDFAIVLLEQKKEKEALPLLKRAVELNPINLMSRLYLGRTYHNLNLSRLAFEQFSAIAKKDSRFPSVHYHLAKLHLNVGEEEKAIRELTIEVEFHPRNALAQIELGEVLLKMGQPQEALEHLLRVEQVSPTSSRLYYLMSKAYRETGQLPKAIVAVRRSIQLDPRYADAYYFLARLYQESGESEKARLQMNHFEKLRKGDK